MIVARLIPADFDQVRDLLLAAHAESKYRARAFDEERASKVIRAFLANPKLFARGLFDEGRIVGLMLGEVADSTWWSTETVATSMVLYVSQSRRGSGHRLVRAFLRWAQLSGAVRANIGVSAGINDDRAGRLMSRIGLRSAAVAYEKEF